MYSYATRDERDSLAHGQDSLNGDVHNHQTLRAQLVRQNLQRVADEQTTPAEGVEDTKDPDKEDLDVTGGRVCVSRDWLSSNHDIVLGRVLVNGGTNRVADEAYHHT